MSYYIESRRHGGEERLHVYSSRPVQVHALDHRADPRYATLSTSHHRHSPSSSHHSTSRTERHSHSRDTSSRTAIPAYSPAPPSYYEHHSSKTYYKDRKEHTRPPALKITPPKADTAHRRNHVSFGSISHHYYPVSAPPAQTSFYWNTFAKVPSNGTSTHAPTKLVKRRPREI